MGKITFRSRRALIARSVPVMFDDGHGPARSSIASNSDFDVFSKCSTRENYCQVSKIFHSAEAKVVAKFRKFVIRRRRTVKIVVIRWSRTVKIAAKFQKFVIRWRRRLLVL